MSDFGPGRIKALYRYPVKGLTPEPLESVVLTPDQPLPFDRAYAIENGPGPFDPAAPKHLQKIHFVMLMRNEQLASLRSRFDDATHTLELAKDGAVAARGDLRTETGRAAIESLIAETVTSGLRGRPPSFRAPATAFPTSRRNACISSTWRASARSKQRLARASIRAASAPTS